MNTNLSNNISLVCNVLRAMPHFSRNEAYKAVSEQLPHLTSPENLFQEIWEQLNHHNLIEWKRSHGEGSSGRRYKLISSE